MKKIKGSFFIIIFYTFFLLFYVSNVSASEEIILNDQQEQALLETFKRIIKHDDITAYGFKNEEELNRVTLGFSYDLYYLNADNLLKSKSQNMHEVIDPSGFKEYVITLDGNAITTVQTDITGELIRAGGDASIFSKIEKIVSTKESYKIIHSDRRYYILFDNNKIIPVPLTIEKQELKEVPDKSVFTVLKTRIENYRKSDKQEFGGMIPIEEFFKVNFNHIENFDNNGTPFNNSTLYITSITLLLCIIAGFFILKKREV